MNDSNGRLLAVIPARGGSQGLPGKNVRPLAGLPLIAHSVLLAKRCPEIARCVVSTDSEEIAAAAKSHGADVPFMRPAELAGSKAPLWPVLRHALESVERQEGRPYEYLLLLDPTSPTRLPEDVRGAFLRLKSVPEANGILSVSKPYYSPVWHGVVERGGWMSDLFPEYAQVTRRQEIPDAFNVNGLIYIWRVPFMKANDSWRDKGKHLMYVTPEIRAASIDDLEQFERVEALIRGGGIQLPWLDGGKGGR